MNNNLFHIHTYRCGHAENISDECYIKEALVLGASDIWFTDHAPFPGNPFRGRMEYEDLNEYIGTLTNLKEKYKGHINVHIGLEIEYFPSFDKRGYYEKLKNIQEIEILLLGQHMAEISGTESEIEYTFSWDKEKLKNEEFRVLGNAIIRGVNTGLFSAVAHPDRIYRRKGKAWTREMNDIADGIINACAKNNIPLELNMHSVACKGYYRPEFWELLKPENKTIIGLDAHGIDEIKRRFERQKRYE